MGVGAVWRWGRISYSWKTQDHKWKHNSPHSYIYIYIFFLIKKWKQTVKGLYGEKCGFYVSYLTSEQIFIFTRFCMKPLFWSLTFDWVLRWSVGYLDKFKPYANKITWVEAVPLDHTAWKTWNWGADLGPLLKEASISFLWYIRNFIQGMFGESVVFGLVTDIESTLKKARIYWWEEKQAVVYNVIMLQIC